VRYTVMKFSENDVKTLDLWNFTQHLNRSFRSVLLSPYKLTPSMRHIVTVSMVAVVQNSLSE